MTPDPTHRDEDVVTCEVQRWVQAFADGPAAIRELAERYVKQAAEIERLRKLCEEAAEHLWSYGETDNNRFHTELSYKLRAALPPKQDA